MPPDKTKGFLEHARPNRARSESFESTVLCEMGCLAFAKMLPRLILIYSTMRFLYFDYELDDVLKLHSNVTNVTLTRKNFQKVGPCRR